MECPDCGFVRGAFDLDCARCEKYGKPARPPAAQASPIAAKDPHCSNCGLRNDPRAESCIQCNAPMSGPAVLTDSPATPEAAAPSAPAMPVQSPAMYSQSRNSQSSGIIVVTALILIVFGGFGFAGFSYLHMMRTTAPDTPPAAVSTAPDPTLQSKMDTMKSEYSAKGVQIEWPYLGNDTLRATISGQLSEYEARELAQQLARDLGDARRSAGETEVSSLAILYDDTGKRLAKGTEEGASN